MTTFNTKVNVCNCPICKCEFEFTTCIFLGCCYNIFSTKSDGSKITTNWTKIDKDTVDSYQKPDKPIFIITRNITSDDSICCFCYDYLPFPRKKYIKNVTFTVIKKTMKKMKL